MGSLKNKESLSRVGIPEIRARLRNESVPFSRNVMLSVRSQMEQPAWEMAGHYNAI